MRCEYMVQKDGYKAKIFVTVPNFDFSDLNYRISDVSILPKGKRKWISIGEDIRERYAYRVLDIERRHQYAKEQYLQYVSWEDMCAALEFAYARLKPDYENIDFIVI